MKIVDKRNVLKKHSSKTYRRRSRSAISNIAIHHSATTSGSAEAFANYHVNSLGWPGIGYHYVISKDGTISQCHDLEVISYHVGNNNTRAVGICMVGNFLVEKPTDAQIKAIIELTHSLLKQLNLNVQDVWGHNEFPSNAGTLCPVINMNEFRNRLVEASGNMKLDPVDSPTYVKGDSSRTYLSLGDQGDDVLALQKRLKELGFDPIYLDGIFGPATYRALTSFQRFASIDVDGVVGPVTREALKKSKRLDELADHASPLDEPDENEERYVSDSRRMLRYVQPMMRGEDVLEVQKKTGTMQDGVFGPMTERAVKQFQRQKNLIVDGIVGPQTWKALDRVSEKESISYGRLLSLQSPYLRGEDVKRVQKALNVTVDGIYGPETERAVKDFQRREGITVDGIVGRQTWERLFS